MVVDCQHPKFGTITASHIFTDYKGNEGYEVYNEEDKYLGLIEFSPNETVNESSIIRKLNQVYNF